MQTLSWKENQKSNTLYRMSLNIKVYGVRLMDAAIWKRLENIGEAYVINNRRL
jgi:hypothetical protein